jgi:sulfopyruvate decarboxylase alpha subunit
VSPEAAWPDAIFDILERFDVRQVAYVPDAGHTRLIERVHAAPAMTPVVLTTEEEGVALCAGAWLGGERSVLLMQSSGVGNCVNLLSLAKSCRFPLTMLVTMRGEWGEFNPWQVPMGMATEAVLKAMDLNIMRTSVAEDVKPVVTAAASMAFDGGSACAVLLSQRLIGAKDFAK